MSVLNETQHKPRTQPQFQLILRQIRVQLQRITPFVSQWNLQSCLFWSQLTDAQHRSKLLSGFWRCQINIADLNTCQSAEYEVPSHLNMLQAASHWHFSVETIYHSTTTVTEFIYHSFNCPVSRTDYHSSQSRTSVARSAAVHTDIPRLSLYTWT